MGAIFKVTVLIACGAATIEAWPLQGSQLGGEHGIEYTWYCIIRVASKSDAVTVALK